MSVIESIKKHMAKRSEVEAALAAAREKVNGHWVKARPVKDWLNGHDWPEAELKSRGVALEYAKRRQELNSLEAELLNQQRLVESLEGELLELQSVKFSAKDILDLRKEECQMALSGLQEVEARCHVLREQLEETRNSLRKAEADVVKAHSEQSGALSMEALSKAQQAVLEAGRMKTTVSALISNLEAALARDSAALELVRSQLMTARKALGRAQAEASAEAAKAAHGFDAIKCTLMEGFAASVEAGEGYNIGHYLAVVFGAEIAPMGWACRSNFKQEIS